MAKTGYEERFGKKRNAGEEKPVVVETGSPVEKEVEFTTAERKAPAPKGTGVSEADLMKMIANAVAKGFEGPKKTLDDHETRIKKLEAAIGAKSEPAPKPAPKKPASESTPKPAPQPETKPVATTQPITSKPANVASTPAPQPAPAPKKATVVMATVCTSTPLDGVGMAFKYFDIGNNCYDITGDIWKAKQMSNGMYTPVYAKYKNGKVDHILTTEELRQLNL